jgi:hypothetical protein
VSPQRRWPHLPALPVVQLADWRAGRGWTIDAVVLILGGPLMIQSSVSEYLFSR